MDEVEKRFKCPYCFEKISMILDGSIEELQSYIEDCEVCCKPIQITFQIADGKVSQFNASGI